MATRFDGGTTERHEDSVEARPRTQSWLRWVYPIESPAVAIQHGLVIGRDGESGGRLAGKGVSRRHAELYRQGPIFVLKDLGSTNGTFLNGKRVHFAPLTPGCVVRIGENVGIVSEFSQCPTAFRGIAGQLFGGHELSEALRPLELAAASNISVMLVGETGTGKERVARALHNLSGRTGKFQALNCAALPKDLAEAELFGYRKGAFTGAERPSLGHFRAADRGTLFLDEVCELPLALQAKLLRVSEEHSVTPLGDTEAIPIDIRIVAAAQKPLASVVAAQQFREDLATRLSGLTVAIPPLRARRTDIVQLFRQFLNVYSGGQCPEIDVKLIECLCLSQWPGNVRELEQLARQLLAVHSLEPTLKRRFLPRNLIELVPDEEPLIGGSDSPARSEHDRKRLALALRRSGNVKDAATSVGFSRQRAYRLIDGKKIDDFIATEISAGHISEPLDE